MQSSALLDGNGLFLPNSKRVAVWTSPLTVWPCMTSSLVINLICGDSYDVLSRYWAYAGPVGQSGLKSAVVDPGSWDLTVQQIEARSTWLRVSSQINYTQIILFMKSYRFGKCFHAIFLYIIIFHGDPTTPPSQNLGVATPPNPQEWCLCVRLWWVAMFW